MSRAKSVFSIVESRDQAELIIRSLQEKGFAYADISVLMPYTQGNHDMGHVLATKAPEGIATGTATGGLTGGVLGLLAGIGALTIPGVGPFVAAGPLIAALSGATLGATAAGIVGGFIGLGIPEVEAKNYEDKLRTGNFLISVHARDDEEIQFAMKVLEECGARDILASNEAAVPHSED